MSSLPSRGYAVVVEPGKETRERDTFTCNHGNELIFVRSGQVNQAPMCMHCMKPICLRCARIASVTGKCTPFEKKIEEMERGR